MNNARRKELFEVTDILDEAVDRLSEIRDDEQEAYDSLPDSLQDSVKGEAIQEALDQLDNFENLINEAKRQIEEYAKPKKNRQQNHDAEI